MTRKEALKKGFLEEKTVYLKLIPKPSALVKDPNHIAYGGFDGSITSLTIGVDRFNRMIDPFRSEKEREYFEEVFKQNLSVYTPNNEFWNKYSFDVVKDPALIKTGFRLYLGDPNQMLHYLVLSRTLKNTVANSPEEFDTNPFCKYVLIEEGHEEKLASAVMDENEEIYTFFGEIKSSIAEMRHFLNVYYATKMIKNTVPENADKEFLHKEIKKIIEIDRVGYLAIVRDTDYTTKKFIQKAIDAGAITRQGLGTYRITGEEKDFGYTDLIAFLQMIEKEDPIMYGRIEAVTNKKKDK